MEVCGWQAHVRSIELLPGSDLVRRARAAICMLHLSGSELRGPAFMSRVIASLIDVHREKTIVSFAPREIRVFTDPDVVHIDGRIDPADDIETINTELILADLQTIEKALPRLEKEARNAKDKQPIVAAVQQAREVLDSGRTVFAAGLDPQPLRELHFLTAKPFLYVFNLDDEELGNEEFKDSLRTLVAPAEAIFLDAKVEFELAELDDDEALELLQSMGQEESGLTLLARVGFATLGLQTYLTAGPKEARAWTIRRGATAPESAGVIHTDFQRGFIKAEVVSYDDLIGAGSMAEAKAKGRVRIEGKDYVMADGDVVEFRFNV